MEDWEIHKNAHDPIIDRVDFEKVQTTFGDTKYCKPKQIEKNMFAGFLKCSDCGANLNYKYIVGNNDNSYFSCRNKHANNGLCKKTHHIRVDMLTQIVKNNIAEIVRFANNFEDEQSEPKQKIKNLKQIVLEDKKHELDVNGFLDIVKKYSEVEELTIDTLNKFIDTIIVYHRETIDGMTSQKIEIFYKMIGNIKIPQISRKEEIGFIKYFSRMKKEKVAC